jgi:hypothetical protein
MIRLTAATASVVPLTVLMLSACVSQSSYDALQAQNQQLQAQVSGLEREASFVEAGDLLFPKVRSSGSSSWCRKTRSCKATA